MLELQEVMTPVLIGVTALLLFLLYYLMHSRDSRYPPGPLHIPVVGNVPQVFLAGSMQNFCEKNRRRFGNAFTFSFGKHKRVVISGYEAMHQLLVKNADYTSSRSPNAFPESFRRETEATPGLVWAPFPHWKNLRSFALTTLREEGMGKAALEPQILEEIDQYSSHYIEPNLGRPIYMQQTLPQATSNIISQLLFSKRFDYDDKSFQSLINAISKMLRMANRVMLISLLPLSWLILKLVDGGSVLNSRNEVTKPTLMKLIKEHKRTLNAEHPRDVTDQYLLSTHTYPYNSEDNALLFCIQLYNAGTDTTATALRWALRFMCIYPDIKQKVHTEIDEQIGQDRAVSFKDHLSMPYTDAVLLESLRYGNIAPTALPHTLEKDMVIDGKLIPAGADLMFNMTSILHDEEVFEEPDKFKPERYLTGDIALQKQRTIPFSIGRRACLGESLAKTEFFMFFVSFLQKYNVRFPDDIPSSFESTNSIINAPKPYQIIFTKR